MMDYLKFLIMKLGKYFQELEINTSSFNMIDNSKTFVKAMDTFDVGKIETSINHFFQIEYSLSQLICWRREKRKCLLVNDGNTFIVLPK